MRKLCLYIALFLFTASAQAEQKTENYVFEAFWGGLKVGDMRLVINQDGEKFTITNIINSAGIAKLVSKYSSVNIASGTKIEGKFLPKTYTSEWKRKKESQNIELQFSEAGDVINESLIPPEREGKRPAVEAKFKKAVFDPVTAAIVSRETIREEMKKNPNSQAVLRIPTYDSKRRFDVICTIKGNKSVMIGGKMQNLLHIHLRREPLAGYTDKDLVEMKEDEQSIDFYLNEDFVPVWGAAKAQMGSATIKLISYSSSGVKVTPYK